MTEVPEHLLRRSRERREALGLSSSGDAAAAPPAADEAPAAEAAPAAATEPAAAPAVAEPAAPPATIDVPVYVEPPAPPRRVPWWMAAVLLVLPGWAVAYGGAFGERGEAGPVDPMVLGEEIYTTSGCAGCHGATGGGGVGPALAGEDVELTFPEEADHAEWIRTGSGPFRGQPYGDPNRPGGQRVAETGAMPGFAGSLSEEEIEAVVLYEREGL